MIEKVSEQPDPFEIARALTRSVKATQLYPVDHPRVENHLRDFYDQLERFHEHNDCFVMGVDNQKLLIQHSSAEDDEVLNHQLFPVLEEYQIGSLLFEKGVTEEELHHLLDFLSEDRDELDSRGSDDRIAHPTFDHIQINQLEVQYDVSRGFTSSDSDSSSSEDSTDQTDENREEGDLESVIEKSKDELLELLSEDQDPEEVHDLVERMMAGVEATDYSPEEKIESIVDVVNMLSREADQAGKSMTPESFQQFFVQMLIEMGMKGEETFSSMMDQMEEGLDLMEDPARDLLFDEGPDERSFQKLFQRVQPEDRGRVIAEEIRRGTPSPDKLTNVIETIAPGGDDLVEVTSSAVREMGHFVRDEDSPASDLSSLFNALLSNTPYKKPPIKVLIIDDDEKYYRYLTYLSEKQYFFDLYTDGQEAWEMINSVDELDYDLVILEIKIPGKNGLEILEHLNTMSDSPPVIICTRYPEFSDAYEITMYPEIRFIEKPIDPGRFQDAVQEFVVLQNTTEEEEEKGEDISEEDLKRARNIQRKLVTTKEPDLTGTDFAIHHAPADRIGGDYIDLIPLEQKRHLFIFANVSGTGVSASMVMVILRSLLHVLMGETEDPREMVIEANRIIAEEIERSMFVRLLLGTYSIQNQSLQLVNAGYNDALFWNQAAGTLSFIEMSGLALGLTGDRRFEDVLQTRNVTLNSGDGIIFCSDGIMQARNQDGEDFGTERLVRTLEQHARSSADELIERVHYELEAFCDLSEQERDRTMLALKSRL